MQKRFYTVVLVWFTSVPGLVSLVNGALNEFLKLPVDVILSCIIKYTTTVKKPENSHPVAIYTQQRNLIFNNDRSIINVHDVLPKWKFYHGLYSPGTVAYHTEKALAYHLIVDDWKNIADTSRFIDYLNSG